jgi:hypothetical protein
MGERPEQLKEHIDTARNELRQNVDQLQERFRDVMDWRVQFQKRPFACLALALGAGALLSVLIEQADSEDARYRYPDSPPRAYSRFKSDASNAWTNIRSALVGLGAMKMREALEQALPGFAQHYTEAKTKTEANQARRFDQDA